MHSCSGQLAHECTPCSPKPSCRFWTAQLRTGIAAVTCVLPACFSPSHAAAVLMCCRPVFGSQGVVNRDIKLENTLLDSSPRPLVKICDFGYSKVRAGQEPVAGWRAAAISEGVFWQGGMLTSVALAALQDSAWVGQALCWRSAGSAFTGMVRCVPFLRLCCAAREVPVSTRQQSGHARVPGTGGHPHNTWQDLRWQGGAGLCVGPCSC